MSDRITLAEAQGYESQVNHPDGIPIWIHRLIPDNYFEFNELPDPFTDANDDYAVLEWVRTDAVDWDAFVKALPHQNLWHFVQQYQIGDYARAALKVIKDTEVET